MHSSNTSGQQFHRSWQIMQRGREDPIFWPSRSASDPNPATPPPPQGDISLPIFSAQGCYLHSSPSQTGCPTFSHRFPEAPDFCTNPRELTSSRCWGRTGTCRCVQTVVAPGQTPGPTASGHQVGNNARHSSVPAERRRVKGGWVKGPGALHILHLPSPPGLPLLHSETG